MTSQHVAPTTSGERHSLALLIATIILAIRRTPQLFSLRSIDNNCYNALHVLTRTRLSLAGVSPGSCKLHIPSCRFLTAESSTYLRSICLPRPTFYVFHKQRMMQINWYQRKQVWSQSVNCSCRLDSCILLGAMWIVSIDCAASKMIHTLPISWWNKYLARPRRFSRPG